jgi:hypothetical protein
VGERYRVDQSDDFIAWSSLFTNTLTSNSFPFTIGAANAPHRFYRAVALP